MENVIQAHEARVNITWSGNNGDLPDAVARDAADGDVRQWVTEAVRGGGVPGIPADANADFRDFVVERFPPNEARPSSGAGSTAARRGRRDDVDAAA